jgi:Cu-Zn family superoxide dismutase
MEHDMKNLRMWMARTWVAGALLVPVAFGGCGERHDHDHEAADHHDDMWEKVGTLIAVLHATEGNDVRGTIRFTKTGNGVKIVADVEGLTPNQKHGFHIHEFGDCSAPDATSAGDHYNPEGHDHGDPAANKERHAGDLGNLQADANGKAHYEATVDNITLGGVKNPIVGRSVIVHAKPDDFGQPTGNAGARIACGVIGVAK